MNIQVTDAVRRILGMEVENELNGQHLTHNYELVPPEPGRLADYQTLTFHADRTKHDVITYYLGEVREDLAEWDLTQATLEELTHWALSTETNCDLPSDHSEKWADTFLDIYFYTQRTEERSLVTVKEWNEPDHERD